MTFRSDPWRLPGLSGWLDRIEAALDMGLAVLLDDPTLPHGVLESLQARKVPLETVTPTRGQKPAAVLADASGAAPHLDGLLVPSLDQFVAAVSLKGLGADDLREWGMFVGRFLAERTKGRSGPSILIHHAPDSFPVPGSAALPLWRMALRRGDLVIWAEEHLSDNRDGAAADLAVALAVELCGWRLDLASALVRAAITDLADPLRWLAGRPDTAAMGPVVAGDTRSACPIALQRSGNLAELQRRAWHAQLIALFPILEERRLEMIALHRPRLKIDEHLRGLGVTSIDEIELGALRYQLRDSLVRTDLDRLAVLARIRNSLAHRKIADPLDTRALIER